MEQIDHNTYRLSTGREVKANCGFIGLNHALSVAEGFDGSIYALAHDDWYDDDKDRWTPAERAELADYMIALWQRFKAQG